jgi:hypothetical protein
LALPRNSVADVCDSCPSLRVQGSPDVLIDPDTERGRLLARVDRH